MLARSSRPDCLEPPGREKKYRDDENEEDPLLGRVVALPVAVAADSAADFAAAAAPILPLHCRGRRRRRYRRYSMGSVVSKRIFYFMRQKTPILFDFEFISVLVCLTSLELSGGRDSKPWSGISDRLRRAS